MAGLSPSGGPITGINMTPLVDISLVLLIIFIVTAKLVVNPAVSLDLPQASKSEEVQTVLSILITPSGDLIANGAPVSPEALKSLAKQQLARQPELRVVISADGGVAHRQVIQVMDTLRVAGITRIAFGVEPTEEGRP